MTHVHARLSELWREALTKRWQGVLSYVYTCDTTVTVIDGERVSEITVEIGEPLSIKKRFNCYHLGDGVRIKCHESERFLKDLIPEIVLSYAQKLKDQHRLIFFKDIIDAAHFFDLPLYIARHFNVENELARYTDLIRANTQTLCDHLES